MLNQVEELASKALDELFKVTNVKELEAWRIRYLGRKSNLIQILRSLATVPLNERREVGARANELKKSLETAFEKKKADLESDSALLGREILDVTLPGQQVPLGRLHPTTQTLEEICDIFGSMGFQVVEGPEVEWDYYNFEALNMPADQPARDMF